MKNRIISLLLLVLLLGVSVRGVQAQSLSFEVPQQDVEVIIDEDGSMTVDYTIVFRNAPGGAPIDIVDMGLPAGSGVGPGDITAEIDGQEINNIEMISNGFSLYLQSDQIDPGETGTVHARIRNIQNQVFVGTQEETEAYASFQFMPNFFGSEYVTGRTDMTVSLVLPPGMNADEPTYYPPDGWPGEQEPAAEMTDAGRVRYTWQSSEATAEDMYVFGGGFPARLVPAAVVLEEPPADVSYPSSGGGDVFGWVFCGLFALFFGGIMALGIYQATVGQRKRKLKYLPPKISIEGHGIKRGLTSIEAAILLEQPVDKIMTMILFSVIKKGAAKVTKQDPLEIEVEDPRPEGLQSYEAEFLDAFDKTAKNKRKKALQDMMVALIKSVTNKMKGFSVKETVAYYEDIMRRAWQQVEAADTPDVKMEKFDEYMGWTMLDKEYDRRTRESFGPTPVFVPMWWGRYDPTYSSGRAGMGSVTPASSAPTLTGTGGKGASLPNLPGSDFAASMVNGVQAFSAGVIGDLTGFTGGITNKTNPPPPPSRSTWRSGGGGGGSSCACACACAGCACACAGGGR
jgi:hypothetical protein